MHDSLGIHDHVAREDEGAEPAVEAVGGEAEEAASVIRSKINPNAKIIWGATVDESMHEELRVMVVLTGVRSEHIFGAAVTNQLKTLKNRSIEFVN